MIYFDRYIDESGYRTVDERRNTGEKDRVRKKRESEMQENVMLIYNAQVEENYTKEKEVKRMGKWQRKNENYSTSK